jgi:4-amino-4-deoxy-L-arabinose transferase-like glycosyltransferase
MGLFGESWRVPHAVASLCSAAAVWLTAGYVRTRFPVAEWRLPGTVAVILVVGINPLVVRYGTVSQAYALCLLAVVAAFRLTLIAAGRDAPLWTAAAGFCVGVAAGSSLLTVPVGPVLLIWLCSRPCRRWLQVASFIAGGTVAFLPVFGLFSQAPRQVFFGIFQYNFLYRQVDWPGATRHNLEVVASWIDSGPALLLLLLAAGGLLWLRFRSNWNAREKSEFSLCGWLALALALYLSFVRPTFERYYLLTLPFLAILAVAGLAEAVARLYHADRPWVPVFLLGFLLAFGAGKSIYEERDNLNWLDLEQTAQKVSELTTPQQSLFADEAIYFLTRHTPPSGMEMRDAQKFNFPPDRLQLFHLLPQAELDRRVQAGAFAVLETCEDQDYIDHHGYSAAFQKHAAAGACTVFWDPRPHLH